MDDLHFDSVLAPDPRPDRGGVRSAYLEPPGAENHASFLHCLPDGALACAWFSGVREARPDASIHVARLEPGATVWSPSVQASDDPERSEQNPVLTALPDGRLWLLYTAQEFGAQDTAIVRQQFSHDGGRSWSAAEPFSDEEGMFIRQPVVLLDERRWLLPVFYCRALPGRVWHGDADHSAVLLTDDAGATWRRVDVPASIGAVHMHVVAMADGELVAFYRSRWGDHVYRSVSTDSGESWTEPAPLEIPNGNSSIQVARTEHDGEEVLLLASNPVRGEEGSHLGDREEMEDPHKRRAPGEPQPLTRHSSGAKERLPLTVAVSTDRGLTWRHVYTLEDEESIHPSLEHTPGRKKREFSYPSIVVDSGLVHVSYSYARRTIKHVALPLELVLGT
ncbi:exo-alpha-sialidase [Ruania suaedae]|uniref:sialidase family protein n=1 Tax=Ruania suaedae TaxID=2897774 RepID=UPI001E31EC13|nr:sialidase family protein [Ruania suaedae]UFU03781.1 exo-alpha-sialidase [Ruania suaedae]